MHTFFPDEGLKSCKIIVQKHKSLSKEYILKIYPNPAKEYIIAEYSLKDVVMNAILEIDNVTGKPVKTIAVTGKHDYHVIPMNDCTAGIFFCRLFAKNKVFASVKFSITR